MKTRNELLPDTQITVDDEPCSWANFLIVNEDGLCKADVETIKRELEEDGRCLFDWTIIAIV